MSHNTLTIAGQKQLLADLAQIVQQRSQDEVSIPQQRAERDAKLQADYTAERERIITEFKDTRAKITAEYQHAQNEAEKQYDTDNYAVAEEQDRTIKQISQRHRAETHAAKDARKRARRRALADFEEAKKAPINEFAARKTYCAQQQRGIVMLLEQADAVLRARRITPPSDAFYQPDDENTQGDPAARFTAATTRGQQWIGRMEHLLSARFIYEHWPVMICIFTALGFPFALAFGLNMSVALSIVLGVVGAIVLSALLYLMVLPIARRQSLRAYTEFRRALATADRCVTGVFEAARNKFQPHYDGLVTQRNRLVEEADDLWEKMSAALDEQRDKDLGRVKDRFESRQQAAIAAREKRFADIEAHYPPLLARKEQEHRAELAALAQKLKDDLASSEKEFKSQWSALCERWHTGTNELDAAVSAGTSFCNERFPDWSSIHWDTWQPSSDAPAAIRFGRLAVKMDDFAGGAPQHADLKVPRPDFALPSLLTFPECPSLLVEADGDARDAAIRIIQNAMLRMLASLPPGKVRFTIIDPTGRGQNFSAFMHLADFDEQLVTSRIWTEGGHINKRLTDITEHMENVIQKYLRNEFESIQDYNLHAGEVAEPYRVLVVANYPANFSEEAARRLISIAHSGARCGVSTLISVDMKAAESRKFDLADLEKYAVTLQFDGDHCQVKDESLGRFPLTLDAPPTDAEFTTAVRTIGKAAEDSSRVEVPFASVNPPEGQWWTSDSRSGVEVPLGRAGATKLQYMRLGRGTSQHVLIAGKTGSGKSTLLNAMITNMAAYYGPDELEFYLIDFKKGVEFKPYATYRLPQARVIAIESEREFGLSVLERLDEELRRRGDLFRQAGVQDVAAWRDSRPEQRMPRVLLVIDEFQELFVADDRVARDATLLMDRLVRQGRAFGIHAILGTQTLAGAYSLARSTIGQMAVRIALQCSESDAHLILSEDNTAARLLSRPGAAIYNDANGLLEGNHPFQIVWLPDFEREACLRQVAEMASSRGAGRPPAIVFEGNIPADPQTNHLLVKLAESGPAGPVLAPRAWLGSSVAIKDPTSVEFARHSGSNLLVVGQHEELAGGMLSASLIGLAASSPKLDTSDEPNKPRETSFIILDGTRADEPEYGLWKRVARSLTVPADVFEPKQCAEGIERAAAELERRMLTNDESAPPLFVVVFNLARFRDLQKSEDDFGFSGFGSDDADAKPNPGKSFTKLLREGPPYGVHAIIWCDSYNNLNRWFDRQGLRDLELRVLFQMSATDSSNLIDSPAAGQLGVNRAVLYNDERGEYERFRPYGRPSDQWLAWVRQTLAQRLAAQTRQSVTSDPS